jgi:hypothetical protein
MLPHRSSVAGIAVWLVVSGVGLFSEWLQGFVTRSPSWSDVAANVVISQPQVKFSLANRRISGLYAAVQTARRAG